MHEQVEAPGDITQLLGRWEEGEPGVLDQLAPLVYNQLHGIAASYLRDERPGHTLQATAVVNEVFVALLKVRRLSLRDRSHFFAFAARIARRTLIDSARRIRAAKRGDGQRHVPLDSELTWSTARGTVEQGALDLTTAMDELAGLDAVKTRAIELRYFLGCSMEETADLLGMPRRTAERTVEFALAWLRVRVDAKPGGTKT